jgi:hypothetical protein
LALSHRDSKKVILFDEITPLEVHLDKAPLVNIGQVLVEEEVDLEIKEVLLYP